MPRESFASTITLDPGWEIGRPVDILEHFFVLSKNVNLLDIFLLKFWNQFWNKSTQVVIFVEFDDFVGFQSSFVFTIFDSGGALFTRGAMTEQGKSHGLQKLYAWQKCHNREMIFCHLRYSDVTNQE